MAKKLKSQAKDNDKQLADAVRDSAQQIWQAGLGAFAKAQEEGGRVFNKLVKEGSALQKRSRGLAEGKALEVRDSVATLADSVGSKAVGSWDKLEQVFEERVARALGSIGIPTQKDVLALTARVEQLGKLVETLAGPAAVKAAAKPAKPVKAKTAAAAKPGKALAVKPAAGVKPAVVVKRTRAAAQPAAALPRKRAAQPALPPAPVKKAAAAVTPRVAKAASATKSSTPAKPAKPARLAGEAAPVAFPTAASVAAANKAGRS